MSAQTDSSTTPPEATEPPVEGQETATESTEATEAVEVADTADLADTPADKTADAETAEAEPPKAEPAKESESDPELAKKAVEEAAIIAQAAKMRSEALKRQRAIKAEADRVAAQRKQVEETQAALAEEMRILRADPMAWLKRHKVSGEDFAAGLEPKAPPPDDMTILKNRVAEFEKREQERAQREKEMELRAQRQHYENQIRGAANKFAEWVTADDRAEEYPITASMLSADDSTRNEALAQWRSLNETAAKSGYSYSFDEVAAAMEEMASKPMKKLVERYTELERKRSSKKTSTATQSSAATGASVSGGKPQSPGSISKVPSSRTNIAKPKEAMTEEEWLEQKLREYEQIAKTSGQ